MNRLSKQCSPSSKSSDRNRSSAQQHARDIYNITHWSQGYFDINDQGDVIAKPDQSETSSLVITELVEQIQQANMSLPVLIRFTDILRHRLAMLQSAFEQAIKTHTHPFNDKGHDQNSYTPLYPIKVNQQRHVVEALLKESKKVGLEAGSKPELMVVMALANRANFTIVCNGYKDREYIRLALIGLALGHRIFIIIEKLSELEMILDESSKLGIKPLLGVRVRLASIAAGKWQNTGGEKSKFGLSAAQLIRLIERLKTEGAIDSLTLLHCHMGSQLSNIRDIQKGLRECARYYSELRAMGVDLTAVDVGGGLGIDYEGARSRSDCSVNYSLQEYANQVVQAFSEEVSKHQFPYPEIMTEAGRAMTAHHAVLVTNVAEIERISSSKNLKNLEAPHPDAPQIIHDLWRVYTALSERSVVESYHEVIHHFAEAQTMFLHGVIDLKERSQAEEIYKLTTMEIKAILDQRDTLHRVHREMRDELNEKLADKLFCNFSLFQSLPDIWAIDQIFPIMPLTGLLEPLVHRGIVQDVTCDSDGRVDHYIDGEGVEKTLPLPVLNNGDMLAFFLVGAYQETLGDMHNLFGDTHVVNVERDVEGRYRWDDLEYGDNVDELLSYLHYNIENLLNSYEQQLSKSCLSDKQKNIYMKWLQEGMSGYTYLED